LTPFPTRRSSDLEIRLGGEEELVGTRSVAAAELGKAAPDQPLASEGIALHARREDAQEILRFAIVPLGELAPAQCQRDRPPVGAAGIVLEVLVQQPVVRRRVLAEGRRQERGVVPETPRELGRIDSLEKGSSLLDASPI